MAGNGEISGEMDNEIESNFSAKNTDISTVTKESSQSSDHFQGVDRIREQVAKAVGNEVLVESSMMNRPGVVRNRMDKERKIGHRRVGEGGEITYKKIQTTQIMGSIQLGIQHTVGSLASKPKRDLLMMDFWEMETISFPPEGSSITPAHHYSEFRFKIYAPIAFRYFRDLFGIQPDDFMMSMCSSPLRELSNPGASGSIFYLTDDDEFIIKTVQHKEGEFLQKLLPGYYMNLNQNPRTLLPKFFGLYCYQCNSKNVRLIAMNNLLPSYVKMHLKYDLKGSTYKRKASKAERNKKSPTYKDLDFLEHHPNGIFLEADTYTALIKTIQRDCRVLESFKIMDYSLLVGVHNLDTSFKDKQAEKNNATITRDDESDVEDSSESHQFVPHEKDERGAIALNRSRSINRQRIVAHSTAMESIQAESEPIDEEEDVPPGGIPARSEKGERLLLFIGIIDILQSYRLKKKLEHTFKSIIHDGDTVSVHRPSFYAQRFQDFMAKTVFKKIPSPLKHSPSKRKSLSRVFQKPVETEIEPNYPSTSHHHPNQSNESYRTPNTSKQEITSTTKTVETMESDFNQINVAIQSAANKKNVAKIQAPLPPLKKKMGIVKQSVPPPVPPRGSPKSSSKHHSPKSGVTFNNDIKMGNVSPGIRTLEKNSKLAKSSENQAAETQFKISKYKSHKSVADLTSIGSPYSHPIGKLSSHSVQTWLSVHDFDRSIPKTQSVQNIVIVGKPSTSVQNLIQNYDTLPKAHSMANVSTKICVPVTCTKPANFECNVSCRMDTLKDVNVRQGFVRDIQKSLLDQPAIIGAKPKTEIRTSMSNNDFNKVRNAFVAQSPNAKTNNNTKTKNISTTKKPYKSNVTVVKPRNLNDGELFV